jgi:ABC-type lipoprotein release transport system permease subunit
MLLLKLAIRNILRQKRRSFLTGLSMALGFLLAAVTMGLVEGSYGSIIDAFTKDRTGHVQIHQSDYLERPSLYKQIRDVDTVLQKVAMVPGVVSATARIFAPSLGFAGNKTAPAAVIGIDPETEARTTSLAQKTREGPFLSPEPGKNITRDGYDQVMIGRQIANSLKLKPGDELVLLGQSVDGSIANDIYIVRSVIGTKDSLERMNVYMSLDAARRYLSMGPAAHEIVLMADGPDNAEETAARIATALDDASLSVDPWQVVEVMFFNAMTADKQGNYITTGVVMAMVAIGVLNAVLMSVLERTREYGLLRAIGTRPSDLFWMIVVETMVLGVLACIAGFILSIPAMNFLNTTGIPIPPVEMGGVVMDSMVAEISVPVFLFPLALVLVTAFLVSLWPAAHSARITPVAALRAS